MISFEWISNKKLKAILLSDNINKKDLEWALDKTRSAIYADESNENVSYEILRYRDRSCMIAEHYFEKGNLNRCLKFIKNTWRV